MAADEEWAVQSKNSTRRAFLLAQKLKSISSCFLSFWSESFSVDKFFECEMCRKVCWLQEILKKHMQEVHPGSKVLEAFYCGKCVSSGK